MMFSAALALFWVIIAVAQRDRHYLLGTALIICAEMASHHRCYRVLVKHALTRKGSPSGRDQDLHQG